jgi:hypothetical protein
MGYEIPMVVKTLLDFYLSVDHNCVLQTIFLLDLWSCNFVYVNIAELMSKS